MSAKKFMSVLLGLVVAGTPLAPAVAANTFSLECTGEKLMNHEARKTRVLIYIDLKRNVFCEDACDYVSSIVHVSPDQRSVVLAGEDAIMAFKEEKVDLRDKSYLLRMYMPGGIRRTVSANLKCKIESGISPAIQDRLSHAPN